ncbi:MAG: RnfABCDGE type electron transport complex subunit D [Planctomycetes bacterium]|nr:RnfABCDGE type electron transport complex subunit D [Planctomycetota bacterium]
MSAFDKTLQIRSSPHILSGNSVEHIMFHVVLALLPAAAFACFAFGLTAVLTLLVAVGACVGIEHLLCVANRKPSTIGDWSAVITGLLYGLTLPPGLPLWMVAIGGGIAIVVGKLVFGGLGQNPFNPALVGRAILQAAFPVAMTTWPVAMAEGRFSGLPSSLLTLPFMTPRYDGTTAATPLSAWKFDHHLAGTSDLALGFTGGSLGETCALLIMLGGLYLAARRMLNWRIPVAILATVALFAGILHLSDPARFAGPLFHLFSGGLMLGAVFMATDMVGSPLTHLGSVIYGVVIGVLVVLIRVFGGMPEGVMYAILIGNALVPHLDNLLRPRVYGTRRGKGAKA